MNKFSNEEIAALDRIMEERHTTRQFAEEAPTTGEIESVIAAGRIAPYASVSSKDVVPFRKFFVITRGNPIIPKLDDIIRRQQAIDVELLRQGYESDALLKEYGEKVEKLWEGVSRNGIKGFLTLPCIIIVAEWRGARRGEKQSLAHMMQNMWLKATALGLGFQLVSPIENMVYNAEFCELFGLRPGEYGFHGCIIGYMSNGIRTSKPASSETIWL